MKVRFSIQYEDLGISFQDAGPWRSYELSARGNTLEEMLEDATISETDQDGGTIDCYGLNEYRTNGVGLARQAGNTEAIDIATVLIKKQVLPKGDK